jgi:hypothetical protein
MNADSIISSLEDHDACVVIFLPFSTRLQRIGEDTRLTRYIRYSVPIQLSVRLDPMPNPAVVRGIGGQQRGSDLPEAPMAAAVWPPMLSHN